jgi:hypothetical protein
VTYRPSMVKVLNVMVVFEFIVSMSGFLDYKYNIIYSTNALQLLITSFGESLLLQILALAGKISLLIQCNAIVNEERLCFYISISNKY